MNAIYFVDNDTEKEIWSIFQAVILPFYII